MYIDNINIFAKNEKEREILIQTIRIYGQDIVMKFRIEKDVTFITEERGMRNNRKNKPVQPGKQQNS